MWGETKQATSATTALVYLTIGALIDVWSVVYYYYLTKHEGSDVAFLYVYGFFFSGLVLVAIGLAVGRIGRSAREAEVAPIPTAQVVGPGNVVMSPPGAVDPGAVAANSPAMAAGMPVTTVAR